MNIICDLDGTIALDHKRNHLLNPTAESGRARDWDAYFDACDTDEPNHAVIALLFAMASKHHIYILSGRSMQVADKTLDWLKRHHIPSPHLQMRAVSDRTDDHILKLRWAKELNLTPKNTLFVLEDRKRVVDAWREVGFTCFQVAPGEF